MFSSFKKKQGVKERGRSRSATPLYRPLSPQASARSTGVMTARPAVWGKGSPFSKSDCTGRRYYDIIVVGGGNAAGYLAHQFVKENVPSGSILIISGEDIPPYERGEYCWQLLRTNEVPKDQFTCTGVKGPNMNAVWYAMNGIDLLLNTYVTDFFGGDRTVECSNGLFYSATKSIIIATGSMPRKLPMAMNSFGEGELPYDKPLKGLHHFSNRDNTLALASSIHSEKPAEVVVVGAGYLGVQMASFIARNGIKVTLVCKHKHIVNYLFTECVADVVERQLDRKGVTIIKNDKAVQVQGRGGAITGIKLFSGAVLPTTCAVVAIGHKARSSVFKELEIKSHRIAVDYSFRTNCPGVYAIGAVCLFPLLDPHLRSDQQAVDARRSGEHCAKIVLKDIAANRGTREAERDLKRQKDEISKELYTTAEVGDAFEPSSHYVRLKAGCAMRCHLHAVFMGESIGDEVIDIKDIKKDDCVMSVWLRDWRVLGVLITHPKLSQEKVLQLAVRQQVVVDSRKLRDCRSVDRAVEVICEKLAWGNKYDVALRRMS